LIVILLASGYLLYRNFNRLLSDALTKSFDSSILSEVYELKFENLRVNVLEGNIQVFNVGLQPREKPRHIYPYINSSFVLKARKIKLENVEIRTLLESNRLVLDKILIDNPEIEISLAGARNIMLPFKDPLAVTTPREKRKKTLAAFELNEFQLVDASIHTFNSGKQREFSIGNFNISLYDLVITQDPGEYLTTFSKVKLTVGDFAGDLKKGDFKRVTFDEFNIGIDSLEILISLDTLMYEFHDVSTGLHNLDIQTADSVFHVSMNTFDLSYKDKSIKLRGLSFKPNVSHAVLQKEHKYQHTEFSGAVGSLELLHVNFDSLIYAKKIFIDEIVLDSVWASIFKDKLKPIDSTRMPVYLGQTIAAIRVPLLIKRLKATNVNLDNTERKPDSTTAKVTIGRATLEATNITNLSSNSRLTMSADAYIDNKVRFKASLAFSYNKPQFSFEGVLDKFNLPDMNALIASYTPAKINKGIADKISFSGVADQRQATGSMKFLYHDLIVDLELQNKAKWKSSVLAFAANTALHSSNPESSGVPARDVKFRVERDVHKGFVNVVIKSILDGLKETMIMSKENRRSFKEAKKRSRQEGRKEGKK
jgi:hypothetical protein